MDKEQLINDLLEKILNHLDLFGVDTCFVSSMEIERESEQEIRKIIKLIENN